MKKYSDAAFTEVPRRMKHGLALLTRDEQRHQLKQDTRHWLKTGHRIEQLPPGPVTAAGKIDSFSSLLLETGFFHEF